MPPDTQFTLEKARLYTLRVWVVRKDSQTAEWRARLQDTQSGEVLYFRDWQTLSARIEQIIQSQNGNSVEQPKEIL